MRGLLYIGPDRRAVHTTQIIVLSSKMHLFATVLLLGAHLCGHAAGAANPTASQIPDGQVQVSSATAICPAEPTFAAPSSDWSGWGGNIYNDRWASKNTQVNSQSIKSLAETCKMTYLGGVSATPTVDGDIVYYPTWSGSLVAVNYKTCALVWEIDVVAMVEAFKPQNHLQKMTVSQASRTSPAIDGDLLYFGTQPQGLVIAVDKYTGKEIDAIQINSNPLAIITTSPTIYNGTIFVGASSNEETAAAFDPGFKCCSFGKHSSASAPIGLRLTFRFGSGQHGSPQV